MDILGNGLGPSRNSSSPSSGMVAFPSEIYESPLLDLTQVTLGIELIPAKPGYFPVLSSARWLIEAFSGAQTTPCTSQAGNDPAHTNVLAAGTSPTNGATNTSVPPCVLSAGSAAAVTVKRFANAPVIFDVTAGAQGTGGFTLMAKFFCTINWFALTQ